MLGEAEQTEGREDELRGENEELETELRRLRRQVRSLQVSLEKVGQYELTHTPAEEPTTHPTSFAELLERFSEFSHLAFTGASGTAGRDFRSWCSRPPNDAYPFSAGKVKMKESDTVGNRGAWRRERTFPVPLAVDRSGEVYMEAHIRIGGGNTVSPRLHFYDDGPGTGRVYVGYIGPHLTNTKT
ncbi:hypothetical protein ACIBLA_10210 [Streptomyces sp. NPDC050433]|uniref:hypothetical protein n=1 Tax=Streptomyces sp. NPDC050433 TaxID=3365615 RepID=UPI0037A64BCD